MVGVAVFRLFPFKSVRTYNGCVLVLYFEIMKSVHLSPVVSIEAPVVFEINCSFSGKSIFSSTYKEISTTSLFMIGNTFGSDHTLFSILRQFTQALPVKSSNIGLFTDFAYAS